MLKYCRNYSLREGEILGTFFIRRSSDRQFYFVLKADNNETIATSEMYVSRAGCRNGIRSVRDNAPNAIVIDTTK
jgi:uncharacterized protein YegP (UPF0339 family)